MQLSIVIPVRNRPQELEQCLAGMARQTYPADQFEVIVVDNGSTDQTPQVAARAGARVTVESIPNRCRARNRGAREAGAPWVAFLDSDCVPEPDWLDALVSAAARIASEDKIAAIAGKVLDGPARSPLDEYIAARRWLDQEKYLRRGERPFERPFALTANLMVRRDVFLDLGGLDPALHTAAEDADWCWRAADAGYAVRYAPEARVTHLHRASLGAMFRQQLHWGRGQADLFAKWHQHWNACCWIEPRHYVWALKGLLKAPWRLATGRTPLERREPFYDFVANSGLILGRLQGGARHRRLVL